ncbi:M15 family metallopeptidase [Luteimonas yindakuii]|uniref:M15 family metallopeptidase n=1 Tax=Luteimonas yindakuii TaxID=2565782 RepID=A0A4Z1RHX5_9GAMM|nr:M15 family metallopeptidase [Luteimonas yindakuii]TKS53739.1 M15 family metallopeptidase [Luteimonas yindakuii]
MTLFVVLLAFFATACVLSWLLLFDGARDGVAAWFARVWTRTARTGASTSRRLARGLGAGGRVAAGGGSTLLDGLRRHRWLLLGSLLLLVLPPLLVLGLRQRVVLPGFDGDDLAESQTMVAGLLRGERLVPPPPPPPAVFTTREIREERPEIVTADRRWDHLDAALQQRVLAIYQVMRSQYGIEMVLVEGYRSPERQAELAREGRATLAGAWSSCHQYGLALDSAPMRDGKLQWDMGDAWTRRAYFLYGELAEQAGLTWGGRWTRLKDYVHVESTRSCREARAARRAADG